jgi:hypothetical protein
MLVVIELLACISGRLEWRTMLRWDVVPVED